MMKWFNKSEPLTYSTREKVYILPKGTSEWSESDWNFFYSKKREEIDLLLKTNSLISLEEKKQNKTVEKIPPVAKEK